MNTVFIGGSRHVSRLPAPAVERLNNVIKSGFPILVGDANGADKSVQKHLADSHYENVTVFCSGEACRNNLGRWKIRHIDAPENAKGFQFYAVKDRAMAQEAEYGLMIWDGRSAGTILNVLRLLQAGKKTVLINAPEKQSTTLRTADDWDYFLSRCSSELRADLKKRATPDEWQFSLSQQPGLLNPPNSASGRPGVPARNEEERVADINVALASGDPREVVDHLGHIAKARGMSRIARSTGLAREGLYRALSPGGNPEFSTVMKVMDSVGLQLMVNKRGE